MRKLGGGVAREKSGNVAMIFALLTPLLVLAAGGAVDVTNAYMRQTALQDATDAAAVGAVARVSPGYVAATQMTADGPVSATNLDANARAIFDANRKTSGDTTLTGFSDGVTRTTTTSTSGSTVTVASTVTSTATFKASFLGLIGTSTVALKAVSHASDNIPSYVDFYVLLDNSPSMGLGATDTDIKAMQTATAGFSSDANCAFACHNTSDPNNYYNLAKKLGVTMRITEVASATQNLMDTATATETANGLPPPPNSGPYAGPAPEFHVSIYDFGASAYVAPGLTTISNKTAVLSQSKIDAGTIDLMAVPNQNDAYLAPSNMVVGNNDEDTNLTYELNQINGQIGTAGSGTTASKPQKVLFFVTDGMTDTDYGYGRVYGGLDTTACTSIKNNGTKIAILYTTYLASSLNDNFSKINVVPLVPTIQPALLACASPGLFYEVSPTNGAINQAMQTLFQKVVASVKITG